MRFESCRYEKIGRVGHLRLDRPAVLNAYHNAMLLEMADLWRQVEDDDEVRVVVLSGEGPAFCAGHDLAHMNELFHEPPSLHYGDIELGIPIIAAIHGSTLGGGASLALAADIRVAADDLQFGYPQVRAGFMSVGGHSWLPRMTHRGLATEMLLTGDVIDAHEAERIGLVNQVVTRDELLPTAISIAERIARNGVLAVKATKEAIASADGQSLVDGITRAKAIAERLSQTHDWQEGIAAFLEKRSALLDGR